MNQPSVCASWFLTDVCFFRVSRGNAKDRKAKVSLSVAKAVVCVLGGQACVHCWIYHENHAVFITHDCSVQKKKSSYRGNLL